MIAHSKTLKLDRNTLELAFRALLKPEASPVRLTLRGSQSPRTSDGEALGAKRLSATRVCRFWSPIDTPDPIAGATLQLHALNTGSDHKVGPGAIPGRCTYRLD